MLNIVPASSGLPADTGKERKAVGKKPAFLITRALTRAWRTAAVPAKPGAVPRSHCKCGVGPWR